MKNYFSIIQKISDVDRDTYVIFFVYGCPYCQDAINILRSNNLRFKAYDIDKIPGGMNTLLNVLNKNRDVIRFNPRHRTKPIIFYNGRYLGGFNELREKIDEMNYLNRFIY